MNTEPQSTNDIPEIEITWAEKFKETAETGKQWENPHTATFGSNQERELWLQSYNEAKRLYSRKVNAEALTEHQKEYDRENLLMRTVRDLRNDYGSPDELRAGARILEELNATGKYTTIEIALAVLFNCQNVRNNSLW